MRLILTASLMLFVLCQNVNAQIRNDKLENNERLDSIKKQIEETSEKAQNFEIEARKIGVEVSNIQRELIKSAAKIQAIEDDVYEKESHLRELHESEKLLEQNLKAKTFEMAATLGAMQRLSVQKTSVVAFKPNEAINTLRTTSLLKVILPDLKGRADILEDDLSELNSVRRDITEQNIELKSELTKLIISNNDIDDLLKRRVEQQKKLEIATKQERDKLKKFAENAVDLQELIAQIENEINVREEAARVAALNLKDRPDSAQSRASTPLVSLPQGNLNFAEAKGSLPLPARGSINQVFGQLLATGQKSKGITIETREGATVIAPHEGRVVFAGNFRTYGLLLIIAHGEGYHTLLAGMENINGVVGQWILKGEPVGQMAASETSSNSRQKLYVEFRQQGKPINPVPWIMAMDRGGR
ncbi:MAG: peptidoglycan DD-metalloendopeptidase family protein [Kordiimonadaceae bacterium]|nr:peptidoglycan DD-metalloendopeptidase family protein [Kordiimonadaceae bacterium]